VLESANPISEFVYKVDNRAKTLSTRFQLIEQANSDPVIIGILQDITKEKEFEKELQAQREAKELEMKDMFDVIQIDPLVFQDFIEDIETDFNYINSVLKDRSMSEKDALTKFFQIVHAIKSNALILGLETFGKKLHALEDDIKAVSNNDQVSTEDLLSLTIRLEQIMQEKDSYTKTIKKIEDFKVANQIDTVLVNALAKAVEKAAAETRKKIEVKAGYLDIKILESKLRKPIKDIIFQCARNSIYHGIEPPDERLGKNKSPQGLLTFSIKNNNGIAELIFSDDGKGLDWEKIKKKHLEKHPETREVSNKTLLPLIFSPEFSTADETSSAAGRGVGLSLVKDIVKAHNGSVTVNSSPSGLTLKFSFPIPEGNLPPRREIIA
jgi:two-component system chemotaxis sensor kinase CheA